MQNGIGIILVGWEVFANCSWIPEMYIFSIFFLIFSFSWLRFIFHLKNLPGKQNQREIYSYFIYTFTFKIRYWPILWNIFVIRNDIHQIMIFANRNNIHEIKLWGIGIGIYLWPKYQRIDSLRIYSQTIHKLFANRELFPEHRDSMTDLAQGRVSEHIF